MTKQTNQTENKEPKKTRNSYRFRDTHVSHTEIHIIYTQKAYNF